MNQETEYIRSHYEDYILNKIDSGEALSEEELKELRYDFHEVDTIYGDNLRWYRDVRSIVEIGGRYFALDWEEGLTELQDNEFYAQPVEVVKHEYSRTITVTDWEEVSSKDTT